MANKKISELDAAITATTSDVIPLVQGGVTKRLSLNLLPIPDAVATALANKETAGAYSTAEKTKLAGIAAGATANRTDAATDNAIQTAVTALVNGAPGALDQLNELAAALGNDANFAATMTAALARRLQVWAANRDYTSGQVIVNPTGQLVTANTSFTSGATYNAANWTQVYAITGTNTGDQTLSLNGSVLSIGGANGNSVTIPTSGGATVSAATTTAQGIVQLAGDLGGTASAPTVPGLLTKAPLASPALTGTPTVPTAAAGTTTTQVASTAFVKTAIDALVAGAPGALDTLKEIADQLAADESAASALTTLVGGKATAMTVATVKTAAYTALANEIVPADATSAAFTVTLPTAPADKVRVTVKKLDAVNPITVATSGSDVLNKAGGSTSVSFPLLNQAATFQYASTGAIWYLVGSDIPLTQLDTRFAGSGALTSKADLVGGKVPATQLPASSGGSSGVATAATALSKFYAAIGTRAGSPVICVLYGDSYIGQGDIATKINARLQQEWPVTGAPAVSTDVSTARTSRAAGVQLINTAVSGQTSATMANSSRSASIAALKPQLYIVMIGANDVTNSITPAQHKANILAEIAYQKANNTLPFAFVLVHAYPRQDQGVTPPYGPWTAYGQVEQDIATADPNFVVAVDLAPAFASVGVPGADSYTLLNSDKLHPVAAGGQLIADLIWDAIRPQLTLGANTSVPAYLTVTNTAAPVLSGSTAVGGVLTTTTGSWSVTPDSYVYEWYRNSSKLYDSTASSRTTVSSDAGAQITCVVTPVKAGYTGIAANSSTVTIDGSAPSDTTAPTISSFTATSGNAQNVLAWSGTDNVAITRWLLIRTTDSVTLLDGTGTSFTDTGRTNGTSYSYSLKAYDAAGNVSTTATASATPAAPAAPSDYGPTLTKTGTVASTTGKFGNAANINGGGGRYAPSTAIATAQTTATVELWVKYTGYNFNVAIGDSSSPNWWIGTTTNGQARFQGTSDTSTTVVINDGVFHHLALVFTSSGTTLYVDGTAAGTSGVVAPQFSTNMQIGAFAGSYGWPGVIDEVRISNVARYTGSFTPPTSQFTADANTLALYHFETP